jgi:hypothetical protein
MSKVITIHLSINVPVEAVWETLTDLASAPAAGTSPMLATCTCALSSSFNSQRRPGGPYRST